MTWDYTIGEKTYNLNEGWFLDTLRPEQLKNDGFTLEYDYYLFVPDGITTTAEGTDNFTVASNLPELLDVTGASYYTKDRIGDTGDSLSFFLEPDFTRLEGLPDQFYTGKRALTQTLLPSIEGIYWEGSQYDDQLVVTVSDLDPAIESFLYIGWGGNDTVYIKGEFANLVEGYRESEFWGVDGEDSLVLEGVSSDWIIQKLDSEVGFEITKPSLSSTFIAREVETIVTDDKTFSYSDPIDPIDPVDTIDPITDIYSTWEYNDGETTYNLKEGWFLDTQRPEQAKNLGFTQDFDYYLFVADGLTMTAEGTDGFTVASNLPELFNATGETYEAGDRINGLGDSLTFTLEPEFTRLEGLPDQFFTGKKALTQTLTSSIEGVYWEGSRFDDELTVIISELGSSLERFLYAGWKGDDTVYLKGDFSNLVEGYISSVFFGDSGNDTLVLEGLSAEWDIKRLDDEVGFSITKPRVSSNFIAIEVETIVTDDKTFSYSDPADPIDPITGRLGVRRNISLKSRGKSQFTLFGDEDIDFSGSNGLIDIKSITFSGSRDEALSGRLEEGITFGVATKNNGDYRVKYMDVDGDQYLDLVVKARTNLRNEKDLVSPYTVASVMSPDDNELFAYAQSDDGSEYLFSSPVVFFN